MSAEEMAQDPMLEMYDEEMVQSMIDFTLEMYDTSGDGNLDWTEFDKRMKMIINMLYDCEWDNIETSHDIATANDSFAVEIFAAIFAAIGVVISMFMLVL